MKKLLLAGVVTCAGFTALATTTYADINEALKESKYCTDSAASDPICMGPETTAQRKAMMAMTKEKAMESRTKYCQDSAAANDPICDPKMMNDTAGF